MASLMPDYAPTLENFRNALESGDFRPLLRQHRSSSWPACWRCRCVTVSLAGYAFARLRFPGRDVLFYVFLLQLMLVPPALIVPNLRTIVDLGLYDTPARRDGAVLRLGLRHLPDAPDLPAPSRATSRRPPRSTARRGGRSSGTCCCRWRSPALVAFAIVSVTAHWNEFLWPLMVINDRRTTSTLTIGLAAFTRGAEGAQGMGRARGRHASGHGAAAGRRSSPSSAASSTASCSGRERLGGQP